MHALSHACFVSCMLCLMHALSHACFVSCTLLLSCTPVRHPTHAQGHRDWVEHWDGNEEDPGLKKGWFDDRWGGLAACRVPPGGLCACCVMSALRRAAPALVREPSLIYNQPPTQLNQPPASHNPTPTPTPTRAGLRRAMPSPSSSTSTLWSTSTAGSCPGATPPPTTSAP